MIHIPWAVGYLPLAIPICVAYKWGVGLGTSADPFLKYAFVYWPMPDKKSIADGSLLLPDSNTKFSIGFIYLFLKYLFWQAVLIREWI